MPGCRKVKSAIAEASLPAFDLGRKVGRKIALQKFRRPVILCVVDLADFDGSLPRAALRTLLPRHALLPVLRLNTLANPASFDAKEVSLAQSPVRILHCPPHLDMAALQH